MVETQMCKLRGTSMFRSYNTVVVVAQNLQKVVRACYIFDPRSCKIYRSVNPLDVVMVSRTIFHNIIILCTDTIKPYYF